MRRLTLLVVALFAATPAFADTAADEVDAAAAAAPNYADPAMWSQATATLPQGASPAATSPQVDVFYVHPTIMGKARPFNQDLADAALNQRTDDSAIARQASAFSGCCDFWYIRPVL